MGMTMIEKILARHSTYDVVRPGEIIDVFFDIRVARDIGSFNVIKQLMEHNLQVADPSKTFFTFDANVNAVRYAENLYQCRSFARSNGIHIFDVESGIGTHVIIDKGLVRPGATLISGSSQANILGAIGALGLYMGDKDIAAAFTKGKLWYRVPGTIKINIRGQIPTSLSAKDLAWNLYEIFGPEKLLGKAVELTGEAIDALSLDSRISLASLASEFNAVTFIMRPNQEVMDYCQVKSGRTIEPIVPDEEAEYEDVLNLDIRKFTRKIVRMGNPAEIYAPGRIQKKGIESAFVGTGSNGRIEDLRIVAGILKDRKVPPGILLKITPATDEIWTQSLQEGLIDIFKEAGAIVTNAGGGEPVIDNGKDRVAEVVAISTGTPDYPGINTRCDLYLTSPAIVVASALAGFITTPEQIPDKPETLFSFPKKENRTNEPVNPHTVLSYKPAVLRGKVWYIPFDNIDTDTICHRRYGEFLDAGELAIHTFGDLSGYEDFGSKALAGDIVVTGRNFGSGSSRQQAVDCFKALGIQAIVAKSFAGIYERNAINAGLPIMGCNTIDELQLQTGDQLIINLTTGEIKNERNDISVWGEKFSDIQMEIYQQGGLFI